MLVGIKVKIYPNKSQEIYINELLDAYRFIFNKCLEYKIKKFSQEKVAVGLKDLGKFVHQHLRKSEDFSFLKTHNSKVLFQATIDLLDAYKRFFVNKTGFPKFKSRFDVQSCRFPADAISKKTFENSKVNLTKQLKGLKFKCSKKYHEILLENQDKVKSATISREKSGQFWISFLVDTEIKEKLSEPIYDITGLDIGIKEFIVDSNSEVVENQHFDKACHKKIKRLQQKLSGTEKGSKNREKARLKLSKAHAEIKAKKNHFLHETTKKYIEESKVIGIEDLNISGMMKTHKLARSIQELSVYEFTRQLEYKTHKFGRDLIRVDRFFPSSQIHNSCGYRNLNLKLSDREWLCESCKEMVQRDYNAALNIRDEAKRILNLIGNCCPDFKPVDSALVDDLSCCNK